MKTKTKRLKSPTTSNLTPDDAELLAGELSLVMIRERKLLAELDAEIKAVQARYAPRLEAFRADLATRFPILQAWAEANRNDEKLFGKKKSIDYIHSEIGFRTGQPKLALLKGWNWKTVLVKLRSWNPDFIRKKEEVDRQAILADRKRLEAQDTLKDIGLRVSQSETFYLDPKATEPEAAQAVSEPRASASAPSQKAA